MAIEKLPDGRWRVDVEPIKGKRYRKIFKTRADAKRFESTCRAKVIENNDWSPRNRDGRTLLDLIALWFNLHGHSLRDGDRRKRALEASAGRLGNPVASRLDPATYARDRKLRADQGISPKTLNNGVNVKSGVWASGRVPV